MDIPTPDVSTQASPAPPENKEPPEKRPPGPSRVPATIVGVVIAVIGALSIWYLVRPAQLLVQGEVDATRLDIAARVDGRVAGMRVVRGQKVAGDAVLVQHDCTDRIDYH